MSRHICRLLLKTRPLQSKSNVTICTSTTLNRFRRGVFPTDLEDLSGLILEEESPLHKSISHHYDESKYTTTNPLCYNTINFEVFGYDMVLVEKFSQNIHRFLKGEKVQIEEVYALPTTYKTIRHLDESRSFNFQESSLPLITELPIHFRVVQVSSLKATLLPLYIQRFSIDNPVGIGFVVKEYTEDEHKIRFKDNDDLKKLKQELAELVATK